MRPITKIFLLLVVAFVAYLLWPRTPSMRGFKPAELAKLRVESWQDERADSGLGAVWTVFRIYAQQYGFSPVASFRIAQNEISAEEIVQKALGTAEGDQRALVALQEKYVVIDRQLEKKLDTDACARGELAWRVIETENGSPEDVAKALANWLKSLYGVESAEFLNAARQLAGARAVLHGAALPEGYDDPERAALELANDGYSQVAEIVANETTAIKQ